MGVAMSFDFTSVVGTALFSVLVLQCSRFHRYALSGSLTTFLLPL